MARQPTKRRIAKSSTHPSQYIRRRIGQIKQQQAARVIELSRRQVRRSISRSLPTPLLPSSTITAATDSIFDSTSISLPSRQIIRARPLPIGRRPLIVGKTYLLDIGKCDVECPNCMALHWMSELSSKGTQRRPSFHTCCEDGSIHLPPLMDAPPYLQHLLSRTNPGMFPPLRAVG
jgi:hypothetical protein